MDYKETLNLPKTEFPMKADLPNKEPKFLKRWYDENIYQGLLAVHSKDKKYILHDGPPYANGHVHLGTAFNKILKDFVVKSRAMMGFNTPFIPGWDCHGMPIEHQVIKNLGPKVRGVSLMDIRGLCREYADKFFKIQREEFKRLGCLGDWDNPYMTMSHEYEASILGALADLVRDGYVYRGLRPIHWCATCKTALAEAEVEYGEHTSPSIFVKFRIEGESPFGDNAYFVIWTTTPWTIPANLAIALHPEFNYVGIRHAGEVLIVAEPLLEQVKASWGIGDTQNVKKVKGSTLEGLKTRHPLIDRDSIIILADHVTSDSGTGCVHTAPGHGAEDFEIGMKYNLPPLNPVDSHGNFTKEVAVPGLEGMNIFKANDVVVEMLGKTGALIKSEKVSHSYPHCWRCKNPLIFRATEQWFLKVDHNDLRRKAMGEIDNVRWIPKWGRDRIYNMVETRPDWCLSRQRYWGVPIPAVDCKKCGETVLEHAVIENLRREVLKHGTDIWFEWGIDKFLPDNFKCRECGATDFEKHTDILDVWFDSSVSQRAVLEEGHKVGWPCDLYLEAVDQHRGWFQVSLLTAIANRGKSPYREVLTHGLILDENQRKMSKSLGNVIAPEEVISKYGADVLRLLFASVDYTDDISFSKNMLDLTSETYRKIRNTCKYLLSNLSDFNPDKDVVKDSNLTELDRFALYKLNELIKKVYAAYENYEFHVVYHALNEFCTVSMSAFYLDILKDRLYCEAKEGVLRRSAQTTLWKILNALTRLTAPVLSFTAEEIWTNLAAYSGKETSVLFASMPKVDHSCSDDELTSRWDKFLKIRSEAMKILEIARKEKAIGNPLEARLVIDSGTELRTFLESFGERLPDLFIVSQVEYGKASGGHIYESGEIEGLKIAVLKATGQKCERCWKYDLKVGDDKRHPTICLRCVSVVS